MCDRIFVWFVFVFFFCSEVLFINWRAICLKIRHLCIMVLCFLSCDKSFIVKNYSLYFVVRSNLEKHKVSRLLRSFDMIVCAALQTFGVSLVWISILPRDAQELKPQYRLM